MRLDKFLSDSTDLSRKDIKALIRKKSVTVNGETILKPETQVNGSDKVTVNGESVCYRQFVYLVLNKPQGYVSATEDKHYPVVTDLVPSEYRHFDVFCAGRLDIDTEGLLILTNDGEFVHNITSPKKNIYKKYYAELDRALEKSDIDAFLSGMEFKDFTAKPAKLTIVGDTSAYVEIAEGKFHQVKRMFERVGKTVTHLKRIAIGGYNLPDTLESGQVTEISKEQLVKEIYGEE